MTDLLFSVIVPTFDRPTELARCLEAISDCAFDRARFEVIVVNDGGIAPDVTAQRKAGINLRVISQGNLGPAAARNYGARASRGRFLAFVDDDCIPAVEWLARLENAVEAKPLSLHGGLTLNVLPDNYCARASQCLVDYVSRYYNDSSANRTCFFASNNLTLSAERFAGTGGFDESFRTAEDRDFCRTWQSMGGDFNYCPDVVIYHAHDLDLRAFQKQHFNYGRGALPYWRKASRIGATKLKVEPLSFYAGMLAHPFHERAARPVVIAGLIVLSQVANAAGFAYEAWVTRGQVTAKADSPLREPVQT